MYTDTYTGTYTYTYTAHTNTYKDTDTYRDTCMETYTDSTGKQRWKQYSRVPRSVLWALVLVVAIPQR